MDIPGHIFDNFLKNMPADKIEQICEDIIKLAKEKEQMEPQRAEDIYTDHAHTINALPDKISKIKLLRALFTSKYNYALSLKTAKEVIDKYA
jgi:hypothetical protein